MSEGLLILSISVKHRNLLSEFIWNKRKPQLEMSMLQLSSARGGLDVPNFKWYHLHLHYGLLQNGLKTILNLFGQTWNCHRPQVPFRGKHGLLHVNLRGDQACPHYWFQSEAILISYQA